jgi:hypothetical protein
MLSTLTLASASGSGDRLCLKTPSCPKKSPLCLKSRNRSVNALQILSALNAFLSAKGSPLSIPLIKSMLAQDKRPVTE